MVFKRMLSAFGVGGPTVDTVLATTRIVPGEAITGEVRIQGGDVDAEIENVTLALVTRVEAEHGGGESVGNLEFLRAEVSGPFRIASGERRDIPFQITTPWEIPVTEIMGRPLHGMALGVRTELAIAKAVDKGDLDMFAVAPLPSQEAVLRAFGALGFKFRSADLEMGRISGSGQRLPFYQEIEFYPPAQHAGRINEVELTFVTDPGGIDVILEADKRGGFFSDGQDVYGRFKVTHAQAEQMDWPAEIGRWLDKVASRRGAHHTSYDHRHHDHGHHGHHGGPGMGTMAAAGAAGIVGGFVAAEAIDEIGDFFEGDE
ncbi:sporulation protein [Bailinhaonella thermotolerans]|uniref:Sporulation protein n=1 Tax=Bailinhaonella thermotolerans TaxID=1070861 RepID=A0A3A4ABQ7_9ACTN|nr:sporulation protein [Bailinhaonella thermotolerans]RJL24237.1 sporulation protein [Bailinhaonella thermotolerans]